MSNLCYHCFRKKSSYGACPFCGYDPADAEKKYPLALKPGSILNGRYTVGRVLGQGGFGITYIALDDQTGERVAIKEYFPSEFAGRVGNISSSVQVHSENQRDNFDYGKAQFLEEARTLAAFNGDEHIVRIYSYFEENNTAYFVMEYVDGDALDKYMARKGGRLTPEEADRLLLPVMQSLAKVHAKGIIHRDIAPDNILITKRGLAKLIDFGAARYSTGEKSKSLDVVLKHGFAPTEQYMRRGRQGPFTDVYAMAATWYYAITGKVPPDAVERMQEDTLLLPSSLGIKIRGEQEDVLLKALEVNAHDRYRNMDEFSRAMSVVSASAKASSGSAAHLDSAFPQASAGFSIPPTEFSPREEAVFPEYGASARERSRREAPAENKVRQSRRGSSSASGSAGSKPRKKKASKAPIIAAVAAVLVAAMSLGYYFSPGNTARRQYGKGNQQMEAEGHEEAEEPLDATSDQTDLQEQTPALWYAEGQKQKEAGNWDAAMEAFALAGDYEDARELLQEAQNEILYQQAEASLSQGNYREALSAYESLSGADYKDSSEKFTAITVNSEYQAQVWADPQAGDIVYFGSYEQDNHPENGKEEIEWIVLSREDDRILVVSRYALDCRPFNQRKTNWSWKNSELRSWLNGSFFSAAFRFEEQNRIPTVSVTSERNRQYDVSSGEATEDRIFVLSNNEAENLFASDQARFCEPTAYAQAQGSYKQSTNGCFWWLRTAGRGPAYMEYVDIDGSVNHSGFEVNHKRTSVRPALWINLES